MTIEEMRIHVREYDNLTHAKSYIEHEKEVVTQFLKELSNDHVNSRDFKIDTNGYTGNGFVKRDAVFGDNFTSFIKTAIQSYSATLQNEIIQLSEKLKQLEVEG